MKSMSFAYYTRMNLCFINGISFRYAYYCCCRNAGGCSGGNDDHNCDSKIIIIVVVVFSSSSFQCNVENKKSTARFEAKQIRNEEQMKEHDPIAIGVHV